ncbi:hypothetical protein TrRE_jg753, partial [Triparma retinervis]
VGLGVASRYVKVPKPSLAKALADAKAAASSKSIEKGSVVQARKLRDGTTWGREQHFEHALATLGNPANEPTCK